MKRAQLVSIFSRGSMTGRVAFFSAELLRLWPLPEDRLPEMPTSAASRARAG
jgi:hypothetical protein